jgi:hypothetical protein
LDKIKSLLPRKALEYFGSLDDKLLVKSAGFHDYRLSTRKSAC